MPTNTYVALDKVTVGTATNTVTFNSINQGYTDLVVVCNLAISSGTGNSKIQFNSDTGSNYSETTLEGTGSSAVSSRYTSNTSIILEGSGFLSTAFQTVKTIHLMNYSNTTTNKTCLVRNGGASAGVDAIVGLWRNTGAITSFTISTTASTFVSGSTFSLYGVKAWAAESTPKATGGYVYEDSTYWYHTFPFSGTFIPNQSLTCDYLVIAGGGGAGAFGGGGGAGGLRSTVGATGGGGSLETAVSFGANTYTVTIGAGGAGGLAAGSPPRNGTNGVASSISGTGITTITSVGGGAGGGADSGNGATGGSGGGGNDNATSVGSGTANQGYAGGTGAARPAPNYFVWAGGGGGAGAVGGNSSQFSRGGAGGNGVAISALAIPTNTGINNFYAGGGGGATTNSSNTGGAGGAGGGGAGANNGAGTSGISGTGGGGGGSGNSGNAGSGGSGLVIIRYAK